MEKKTILAAAAVFCCAFLRCDNPTDKDSLSWYSTVDIPINIELRFWPDAESIEISADNSVIVDMSKSSFTIEEVFLIKKLRNPTVEYRIRMDNKYKNLDFVFYAIFAPKSDDNEGLNIEEMDIETVYYDLIMSKNSTDDYVMVFGADGFSVGAGKERDTTVELLNDELVHRVLSSPSISWRWLAKISRNDYESVKLDTKQAIDTRFRLRVRGISNLDSLFTIN